MELELELELELKLELGQELELELELIASDCKAFAHSDGGLCRFRAASAHLGCAKTGALNDPHNPPHLFQLQPDKGGF